MPNNLRCLINFEIVRLCSECIYGIHFVYASLIKDLKPGSVNPRFLTLFWCGFDPSVFVCPQNELGFCAAHECDEPAGCRPVLCAGPTGRSVASTRLTCDRQHVCVSGFWQVLFSSCSFLLSGSSHRGERPERRTPAQTLGLQEGMFVCVWSNVFTKTVKATE